MSDRQTAEALRVLAQLRPGYVLTAEDVSTLTCLFEQPWQRRKRRLDERDAAIREARKFLHYRKSVLAARTISVALRRLLAIGSLASLGSEAADRASFEMAIKRIAELNCGKSIGWRQIDNILKGTRATQI
jgi:hypothetical protein